MKILKPTRLKRKLVPEGGPEAPAIAPPDPPETTPAESPGNPEAPPNRSSTRGLLRKSAIRRFLKNEFDFPLQVREAFFVAMESKFSDDLRRSVARARELKRNTLMAPDA